jgi:hypothetical protein
MWNRRGDDRRLEEALRARRADAPAHLVRELSATVAAASAAPRRAWSRVAFASAVSVLVIGMFASLGGLSYAASGAQGTYGAVKKVVVTHKLMAVVPDSSASNQYKPAQPPKPASPKPASYKPPTPTPPKVEVAGQAQGQTLPFTGLSLLGTGLVSLALIGVGVLLRRREQRG